MPAFALAVIGCGDNAPTPAAADAGVQTDGPTEAGPYQPTPDERSPFDTSFTVTIDRGHPDLQTTLRQPQPAPVTVSDSGPTIIVHGFAKTLTGRPELLAVELFLVNQTDTGLRELSATLTADFDILDISRDPLTKEPVSGPLTQFGVASEGVSAMRLAIPAGVDTVTIEVTLDGFTTSRAVTHSSPIAITPDDAEAWVAVPDADMVVVVDTVSDTRVAQIAVPARPRTVAITDDGSTVLVASSDANSVSVIDRASRTVIQTLTESDGIGRDSRFVVVSPDGAHAYVSAYVGDVITALARRADNTYVVDRVIAVGRRPVGMSVSSDSGSVFVTHFMPRGVLDDNESWLSVVDTESRALIHEAVVRDTGNLDQSACTAAWLGVTPEETRLEGVRQQLAGAYLHPSGNLVTVPALSLAPTPIWEIDPGISIPGVAPGRNSPLFLLYFDTRIPAETAPYGNHLLLDIAAANPFILGCQDLDLASEHVSRFLIPGEPGAQVNSGAATPVASTALTEAGGARFVAYSRGGRRLLSLSYVGDEISVFDPATFHPATVHHLPLSGANPTGMAITNNGQKGYVSYDNSLFVSVLDMGELADPATLPTAWHVPYDYRDDVAVPGGGSLITQSHLVRYVDDVPETAAMSEIGQVVLVDEDPMPADMRRGRILFTSSSPSKYPQLSSSPQASCMSCHPDGGNDGSVWGTMEGERRTLALYGGVAGRGWLHQSGTHIDAEEFVRTVVPERLGGTGLSDEDYQAMARYIAFGIPSLQTPVVDTVQAKRGQELFEQHCTGCHSGDYLTGGAPDPDNPYGGGLASGPLLVDVGTSTDDAGALVPTVFTLFFPPVAAQLIETIRGDRELGANDSVQQTLMFRPRPDREAGQFRPPSLVNVWDNVVFFHDGRFDSLADVVAYFDDSLQLNLKGDDRAALVEYLKTL